MKKALCILCKVLFFLVLLQFLMNFFNAHDDDICPRCAEALGALVQHG